MCENAITRIKLLLFCTLYMYGKSWKYSKSWKNDQLCLVKSTPTTFYGEYCLLLEQKDKPTVYRRKRIKTIEDWEKEKKK